MGLVMKVVNALRTYQLRMMKTVMTKLPPGMSLARIVAVYICCSFRLWRDSVVCRSTISESIGKLQTKSSSETSAGIRTSERQSGHSSLSGPRLAGDFVTNCRMQSVQNECWHETRRGRSKACKQMRQVRYSSVRLRTTLCAAICKQLHRWRCEGFLTVGMI